MSPGFRAFVLEQLGRAVPQLRSRSMFGGVGLYSGARFFALIDNDTLFFKVDDVTRGDFERRGMEPFRPGGADGETMGYYELPADVLEDPDALRQWADQAVAVAARRKRGRPRRTRRDPD
ncbi:MAG TPA: TfoX/Sxy family protein [Gemmatimonadales bacterium]|nr:TfoX/Sxy family protein [Gemmatimonadales bacterium]